VLWNIKGIKIGTRFELELVNSLGEKVGQTYISQLIDSLDGDKIAIATPIRGSRVLFIPIGSTARLYFLDKKLGLLSLLVKLESKMDSGNIQCIVAHAESDIEKIQRRKYYRLDCNLTVYYRICEDTETAQSLKAEIRKPLENDSAEPKYKKGLTKNLSGSGLCIITEEMLQKYSTLEVILWINDACYVRTVCSVMRASEIVTPREKKYEMGLHIDDITEGGQNQIIKYVFEKQKELLKRQTL
jgi:c-di-GMP-binding flagellar brake protein YcgR